MLKHILYLAAIRTIKQLTDLKVNYAFFFFLKQKQNLSLLFSFLLSLSSNLPVDEY